MTVAELRQRLEALEHTVSQLTKSDVGGARPARDWWRTDAGRFADDPVFDEVIRLGEAYRGSLAPDEPDRDDT